MADDDRPSDERVSRLTDEQIDFAIRMVDALPESEHLISILRARVATYRAEIERLRAEINDLRLRLVALSIPKDTDRG